MKDRRVSPKIADEVMQTVRAFIEHGGDRHDEWKERAAEGRRFYRGKQWDDEELAVLAEQGRPPTQVNRILPTVKFLCGEQRRNRKDPKVVARRGGSDSVANLLTAVAKHAADIGGAIDAQNACFDEGLQTGRGWMKLEFDFDSDPFSGDVRITSPSPFYVREDPMAIEYDLQRSCKYIIEYKLEDREIIDKRYPFVAASGKPGLMSGTEENGVAQGLMDFFYGADDFELDPESDTIQQAGKYRYVMIECWWKTPAKRAFAIDLRTNDVRILDPKRQRDELAQIVTLANEAPDVYSVVLKTVPVLKMAQIIGGEVIRYVDDPLKGLGLFPYARFSPHWQDGYAFGVIDNLIDPQREVNKRRSQALDNLNRSNNSGWVAERLEPGYREQIEAMGNRPGVVLEKARAGGYLEKIDPSPLSGGHVTMEKLSADDIQHISGVNYANLGQTESRQESGKLNELRQRQGMQVNEVVYDNFDATIKGFYKVLVECIRTMPIYTEVEIRRIVEESGLVDADLLNEAMDELAERFPPPPPPDMMQMMQLRPEHQQLAQQMYAKAVEAHQKKLLPAAKTAAESRLLEQMRNWGVGRYAIAVTQSPHAETTRIANFLELDSLAQRYPGLVPPDALVEASSLPRELRDRISRQMQQMAATAPAGGSAA